jgi:hypothetical protein
MGEPQLDQLPVQHNWITKLREVREPRREPAFEARTPPQFSATTLSPPWCRDTAPSLPWTARVAPAGRTPTARPSPASRAKALQSLLLSARPPALPRLAATRSATQSSGASACSAATAPAHGRPRPSLAAYSQAGDANAKARPLRRWWAHPERTPAFASGPGRSALATSRAPLRSHRQARASRRGRVPRVRWLSPSSCAADPRWKTVPIWPASAAQAADWPRLAEVQGSLDHDLALKGASEEPAGRDLSQRVPLVGESFRWGCDAFGVAKQRQVLPSYHPSRRPSSGRRQGSGSGSGGGGGVGGGGGGGGGSGSGGGGSSSGGRELRR